MRQALWFLLLLASIACQHHDQNQNSTVLSNALTCVAAQGLNVRQGPGTDHTIVGSIGAGKSVVIGESSQVANGYTWRPLANGSGWVAGEFLANCGAEGSTVAQPSQPPQPVLEGSGSNLIGYNIHDVDKHHFYANRMGNDMHYKSGGSVYVLQVVFFKDGDWRGQINRAKEAAAFKGDLLVVRADYKPGNGIPTTPGEREAYLGWIGGLLDEGGIAFVQAGNEPNLHHECQEDRAGCNPEAYHPILDRFRNHSRFLMAGWTSTNWQQLQNMDVWTWADKALRGRCPKTIGIHAYPSMPPGWTRPQMFAQQLIEMNLQFIRKADCLGQTSVLITEANGNEYSNADEWADAVRTTAAGIRFVNQRMGRQMVLGALLFTLGDPDIQGDDMKRFYISINDDVARRTLDTA